MILKFREKGVTIGEDWSRRYRRPFVVDTTDNGTAPGDPNVSIGAILGLLEQAGIRIGMPYSDGGFSDGFSVVESIELNQNPADYRHWDGSANYAPPRFADGQSRSEDPTEDPPEIELSGEPREVPTDRDRDGNPIRNSAGDPFSTTLNRDDSRMVLSVTKNEPDIVPRLLLIMNLRDHVNESPYLGFPAETLLFKPPGMRRTVGRFGPYWRASYKLHVDANEWTTEIGDTGKAEKIGSVRKPILSGNEPIDEPVALDGRGRVATSGTPYVHKFKLYKTGDFSILNLE